MSGHSPKPVVLVIRDGWGANPNPQWNAANAVYLARTPVDDRLMTEFPHALIRTSGRDVGLPEGIMGNSEVGHQNIGAGRIVEQAIMRITNRIHSGDFFDNKALRQAFDRAKTAGGKVHLIGLCSDGRVHSDLEHLEALISMPGKIGFPPDRVFVHAITDGRDTAPHSGKEFLTAIESQCAAAGVNPIASVVGRYYAMDRDQRWDRIECAYRLLVDGDGARFTSATDALDHYYENPSESNRKGDEFVVPSLIELPVSSRFADGDSVIFFNYRGDRPRQITRAFVDRQFAGFDREKRLDLHYVTLTSYERGLPVNVAFDNPEKMRHILGAYLSEQNRTQFRCAETEKYPHVTFFFNDYVEEPFVGEQRCLIDSPRDVSTYDQKPEMSAPAVTEAIVERLTTHQDGLIVVNFANGDMVGHTGNLAAAVKAVETVDASVGRIVDAVLEKGGSLLVTADHGNCEQMIDPATGGPHTAHTTFDVECILVGASLKRAKLRRGGRLADIAPTLLQMMHIKQPDEMTGRSLIDS